MSKKKILIVEDEDQLAYIVKIRLEASGYDVITAYDGQEGLKKARSEVPDLIILDVMLPKIDGFKVCGLLKNDSRYSSIPIIIFTARAHEKDIQTGKKMGADDYIAKPFQPNELLEKIQEHLS